MSKLLCLHREARRLTSGALMKWLPIIPICALAVFATACEKHPASELSLKHGAGEHHAEAKGEAAQETKPAEHAGEAKPAEAPKFFPENK